jgi:RNA polymerase sigma-70 factor (ECF subfamily)
MPPQPERYVGREIIGAFLATVPGGGRLDRFRLVPTRANCQPAVAAYYRDGDTGPFEAHAVIVLSIEGNAIASLVRFADTGLFGRFGLPMAIDDEVIGAATLGSGTATLPTDGRSGERDQKL